MSTLAKLLMGASGGGVPTDPVPVGSPFGGGFYAGMIMIDGQAYALVVAPKAQGQASNLQWNRTSPIAVGANSRNDGWANTQAMVQEGIGDHPAAEFCVGLNINGYDDWYLPSQDELEILYRAFKPTTQNNTAASGTNPSAIPPTGNYSTINPPQTNVAVFRQVGESFYASPYWSSTHSSTANTSWSQDFSYGYQVRVALIQNYQVRAVRRVAI